MEDFAGAEAAVSEAETAQPGSPLAAAMRIVFADATADEAGLESAAQFLEDYHSGREGRFPAIDDVMREHYRRGHSAAMQRGDFQSARTFAEKCYAHGDQHPMLPLTLLRIYLRLRDTSAAEELVARHELSEPDAPRTAEMRALLAMETGAHVDAFQMAMGRLEQGPAETPDLLPLARRALRQLPTGSARTTQKLENPSIQPCNCRQVAGR